MQFRVDTEGTTFIVGGVRGVVGFESNSPVLDKATGRQMFDVDVMAVAAGERPEQLTVRVAGEPAGIGIGVRVRVHDLVARPWEMGDRHGMSFRASRVEPYAAAGRAAGDGKAA